MTALRFVKSVSKYLCSWMQKYPPLSMQLTVIRYGSPSGLRQGWSPGRSGRSSNDSFGTLNVLTEFTHEIVSLIMSAIFLIIFFLYICVRCTVRNVCWHRLSSAWRLRGLESSTLSWISRRSIRWVAYIVDTALPFLFLSFFIFYFYFFSPSINL